MRALAGKCTGIFSIFAIKLGVEFLTTPTPIFSVTRSRHEVRLSKLYVPAPQRQVR